MFINSPLTLRNISNNIITQSALSKKLEASDIVNKLDKNGYTGSVEVVTSVDFTNETVTTKTISYTDGQITDVS